MIMPPRAIDHNPLQLSRHFDFRLRKLAVFAAAAAARYRPGDLVRKLHRHGNPLLPTESPELRELIRETDVSPTSTMQATQVSLIFDISVSVRGKS
jgi:hypothetical protein